MGWVDDLTRTLDETAPGWDLYRGMDKQWHAKAPIGVNVASATLTGALIELRDAVASYVPPVPRRPQALSMRIVKSTDDRSLPWHVCDNIGFVVRVKTKREAQSFIDRMTDARDQEIADWERQYGGAVAR